MGHEDRRRARVAKGRQQHPDVVGINGGMHGDVAVLREWKNRWRAHARKDSADRRQRLRCGVHHHVTPASRRDHAGQHQLEPPTRSCCSLPRRATADEHSLRGQERSDQTQPVRTGRRARRDEIDDGVGETEARRRLDRTRNRHELRLDPAFTEQLPGRNGVGRRDAEPAEVRNLRLRRVVRHCGLQRAAREPELRERQDIRLRLDDQVRPGHPEVHDAVLDVLGNVARPHEQEVDGRIGTRHHERSLGRLERETRVGQKPAGSARPSGPWREPPL